MLVTSRHSLHGLFWGQRGTMTQHQHTHSTAYKNRSFIPLSLRQQNTLFVTSAGAATSWLTFCFSCSVIQGCSHTNRFPAQEKYPQEQTLVREIHSGVGKKSVLLQLLSRHSTCIPQLSFEFWGILKDWTCSGLQWFLLFWSERQIWIWIWRRDGAKGHFKTASHPNVIKI